MKKFLALLLATAMAFSLAACGSSSSGTSTVASTAASASSATPEELSGTIEVWSSGEELGRFVEGFNKVYPNVKVNITVVPNADFIAKLTPVLSSGEGVPDIFTGESDYVKYLVESGYWDDLRADPMMLNSIPAIFGIMSPALAPIPPAQCGHSAGRPPRARLCIAATWPKRCWAPMTPMRSAPCCPATTRCWMWPQN